MLPTGNTNVCACESEACYCIPERFRRRSAMARAELKRHDTPCKYDFQDEGKVLKTDQAGNTAVIRPQRGSRKRRRIAYCPANSGSPAQQSPLYEWRGRGKTPSLAL